MSERAFPLEGLFSFFFFLLLLKSLFFVRRLQGKQLPQQWPHSAAGLLFALLSQSQW